MGRGEASSAKWGRTGDGAGRGGAGRGGAERDCVKLDWVGS